MKATIKFLVVAGFAFFMGMGSVGAQGWEKFYNFCPTCNIQSLTQTPDSSIWLAGYYYIPLPSGWATPQGLLVKLDKNGIPIFSKFFPTIGFFEKIRSTSDDGVVIVDTYENNTKKFDKNGSKVWSIKGTVSSTHLQEVAGDKILVVYKEKNDFLLYDKDGINIWDRGMDFFLKTLDFQTDDKELTILLNDKKTKSILEVRCNYNGDTTEPDTIFSNVTEDIKHIKKLSDNSYIMIYEILKNGKYEQYVSRFKNKKIIWKYNFPDWNIIELIINKENKLVIAGDRKSTRLNSSHPSISRMPSSA